MRPRPPIPGGPYLVIGLARSGQAAARLLSARGEEVLGADAGAPPGADALAGALAELRLRDDGVELLGRARCVVKSPGVPRQAPAVAAALAAGLPVIGELELAWRLLPNRFCAVTGTNGKTTVCELIGHVLREAGEPVAVAGNVGTPLASLAGAVEPSATIVCECSSFQLEDAEAFAPECGVLLNLSPDHIDRHGSMRAYVEAKLRLFRNQAPGDVAILDLSDPALRGHRVGGAARRVDLGAPPAEVAELARAIRLPGPHNAANARAAAAACLELGVGAAAIRAGFASFRGVPHRLELVRERDGVRFVNDSKATNVAAAAAALRSFDAPVHAILGGSLKGRGFEALAEPVRERCAACYLIGEAAERLARDLAPAAAGGVAIARCRDLADAVARAAAAARPGDVVLLAPACASYDAYRDFEERGEDFRALVESL